MSALRARKAVAWDVWALGRGESPGDPHPRAEGRRPQRIHLRQQPGFGADGREFRPRCFLIGCAQARPTWRTLSASIETLLAARSATTGLDSGCARRAAYGAARGTATVTATHQSSISAIQPGLWSINRRSLSASLLRAQVARFPGPFPAPGARVRPLAPERTLRTRRFRRLRLAITSRRASASHRFHCARSASTPALEGKLIRTERLEIDYPPGWIAEIDN